MTFDKIYIAKISRKKIMKILTGLCDDVIIFDRRNVKFLLDDFESKNLVDAPSDILTDLSFSKRHDFSPSSIGKKHFVFCF